MKNKIKELIWKLLTITTLVTTTLQPLPVHASTHTGNQTHKTVTQSYTVFSVSPKHGNKRTVTIETHHGNLFKFSTRKRWKRSDKGIVIFDTKGTKTRKDDVITGIRKNVDLYNTYNYIENHYKDCTVKVIKETGAYNNIKLKTRKGKHIVYIEVIKSVSHGRWGRTTKYGSYIKYNKPVRKGKKVTSYCIYNPNTNWYDDVTAVIDNKMIR